jgi:hypothetical protein
MTIQGGQFTPAVKSCGPLVNLFAYCKANSLKKIAICGATIVHRLVSRNAFEIVLLDRVTGVATDFYDIVTAMRTQEVEPVFVFDGDLLPGKEEEQRRRQTESDERAKKAKPIIDSFRSAQVEDADKDDGDNDLATTVLCLHDKSGRDELIKACRETATTKVEIFRLVFHTLRAMEVAFVVAPYESESQITFMLAKGQVDAAIVEDGDHFLTEVRGRPLFVSSFQNMGRLNYINGENCRVVKDWMLIAQKTPASAPDPEGTSSKKRGRKAKAASEGQAEAEARPKPNNDALVLGAVYKKHGRLGLAVVAAAVGLDYYSSGIPGVGIANACKDVLAASFLAVSEPSLRAVFKTRDTTHIPGLIKSLTCILYPTVYDIDTKTRMRVNFLLGLDDPSQLNRLPPNLNFTPAGNPKALTGLDVELFANGGLGSLKVNSSMRLRYTKRSESTVVGAAAQAVIDGDSVLRKAGEDIAKHGYSLLTPSLLGYKNLDPSEVEDWPPAQAREFLSCHGPNYRSFAISATNADVKKYAVELVKTLKEQGTAPFITDPLVELEAKVVELEEIKRTSIKPPAPEKFKAVAWSEIPTLAFSEPLKRHQANAMTQNSVIKAGKCIDSRWADFRSITMAKTDGDLLFVKAQVPASMKAVFYEVLITFRIHKSPALGLPSYIEIIEVHCSCVAGNLSCHHGVALGVYISQMTSLSPTSRGKEWGAVKAKARDGSDLTVTTPLRLMKVGKGDMESLLRGGAGPTRSENGREQFKLHVVELTDADKREFINQAKKLAKTSVAGAKYVAREGSDDES